MRVFGASLCAATYLLAQGPAPEKYHTVRVEKVDHYPQVPIHVYLLPGGKQCALKTRLNVQAASEVKTASEGDDTYLMDNDGLVYKCGLPAVAGRVGPNQQPKN